MGYGDRDMHFLGATELTDVAALDVILDLFSHSRPEVSCYNLLFCGPDTVVG